LAFCPAVAMKKNNIRRKVALAKFVEDPSYRNI
jgi:hypothetical protein